ncbi:class I adenylate-forming enzyme family protein [Haliea sp. E17]|uniref:class I adenylate-forming enzyme family protein n=1 Tax=Haliea sp. E17 TaxID=3401576 RepID=UPI003AAC5455
MDKFESISPLLPEILALHGKWRGSKEAVICDNRRWTWAEFCAASHQLAHGLVARGIKPGERVAVVMSNSLEMVQALCGVMAAGACSVPINLSVSDEALVGMLADAGASALIASEDQRARLDNLDGGLPAQLALRIVAASPGSSGWLSLEEVCKGQPAAFPGIAIAPDAPLNIIYSSGTTGLPKGILHTHQGRLAWAMDLAIALRYHGSARSLFTIGLYSNISWVGMLCTLLAGGTAVVCRSFDPADTLRQIERERISHIAMVPIQYQRVIEALKSAGGDVSSMQAMMSCGSPLHEGLKQEIFEQFSCGVIELYGLTEGIITTLEPEEAQGRWSSVGRPLLGTDICIIDDEDRILGPDQPGEIVSRARIAMPCYWGREDVTAQAMFVDSEGKQWLRSGDIGYYDSDGYFYIVDRKKDMILSGGQNVYPQDIEAVLVQHPEVDDAAVIGLPSRRWGETPVALVVPVAESGADHGAIREWTNGRVGKQQRIAEVIFVDELPRNPNGKILKRELRQTFGDRHYE